MTAFARLVTVGLAVVFLLVASALSGFGPHPASPQRAEIKAPVHATHASLTTAVGVADLAEDNETAPSLPSVFIPLSIFMALLLPGEAQRPGGFQRRFFTLPLRRHLLVGVLLI